MLLVARALQTGAKHGSSQGANRCLPAAQRSVLVVFFSLGQLEVAMEMVSIQHPDIFTFFYVFSFSEAVNGTVCLKAALE